MTAGTRRRRRLGLALAIAAAALVVAMAASALALGAVRGAPSASAARRGGASVDIANFAFHPPTLRVGKGARVTFVNSSKTTHTATRAGSFDTGRIKPGKAVTVRFAQKGTFAYHCKIHPFMKGKIVVE
jgi:plastocyanin